MWDLPGPGLEPVSPALAGGFLTIAPPGKSPDVCLDLHGHSFSSAPTLTFHIREILSQLVLFLDLVMQNWDQV